MKTETTDPNLQWFDAFVRIPGAFWLDNCPKFNVGFPKDCTALMCVPLEHKQDVFELTEEKELYLVIPDGIIMNVAKKTRAIRENGPFIRKLSPEAAAELSKLMNVYYIPLAIHNGIPMS